MAAAFRHDLIFDLNGVGTGPLECPYSVTNVDGIAESSIRVDDEWKRNGVAGRRGVLREFWQTDDADVGNTEEHIRDAGSCEINGLKTQIFDDARA